MNPRTLALLAATAASAIYGINHTLAKGLMPDIIGPFGFIVLRVVGAAVLFWITALFLPKELRPRLSHSDLCIAYWEGVDHLV